MIGASTILRYAGKLEMTLWRKLRELVNEKYVPRFVSLTIVLRWAERFFDMAQASVYKARTEY